MIRDNIFSFHFCRVEVCHDASSIKFHVKDKDHAYSEYIGAVSVSVEALVAAGIVEGDFPIVDSRRGSGSGGGDRGHLSLRVQFIRTSEVVPSFDIESYFPMKTNNSVTLYQAYNFIHL